MVRKKSASFCLRENGFGKFFQREAQASWASKAQVPRKSSHLETLVLFYKLIRPLVVINIGIAPPVIVFLSALWCFQLTPRLRFFFSSSSIFFWKCCCFESPCVGFPNRKSDPSIVFFLCSEGEWMFWFFNHFAFHLRARAILFEVHPFFLKWKGHTLRRE